MLVSGEASSAWPIDGTATSEETASEETASEGTMSAIVSADAPNIERSAERLPYATHFITHPQYPIAHYLLGRMQVNQNAVAKNGIRRKRCTLSIWKNSKAKSMLAHTPLRQRNDHLPTGLIDVRFKSSLSS